MLSKELLERFKRGEVVFHTPTKEIFDKAVEAAEWIGCIRWFSEDAFERYTYNTQAHKSDYPQLEIVTLKLDDFDSEPQAESADIQRRLVEITQAIAYFRKLEETYDADLELDGLYTAREEILRELEDSLEIHL